MTDPLHVAYVTVGQADDMHEWSGLNAAIRASIERQGCIVSNVDRLGTSYPFTLRLTRRIMAAFGSTYALERSPHAAARWSRVASEKIAQLSAVDAIVSTGVTPVSRLAGDIPLALWSDATFHSLRTTYPEYANYSRRSIEEGDRMERAALARASLVCYASQWAADDAVRYYGVPARKVRVVEFGANVETPYADEHAAGAAVAARSSATMEIAFIGVDWERKGGPLAVDAVRRLNDAGVPAVLTVAGCVPPAEVTALPYVRPLGFLSKKVAADRQRLHDLLTGSHVLLLPTMAECFGLVFAEAAAHAVPSISRDVGGVASAIAHGETGLLMDASAGAEAYCGALRELRVHPERYRALSLAAYRDFQRRLNWRVAGRRFTDELRAALASAQPGPAA
jgi:glycosyltransferase involved in cell wall biosynthesis